jgi:hypothetical protein
MKNLIHSVLFAMVIGLVFSCVYESYVPIDKASVPIDKTLLFTWENMENGDRYTLSRLDELNYSILAYNKANNSYTKMRAYTSIVNGTEFLNVWDEEQGNRKRKYSIMKIVKIDAFTFNILPLTSNITEQFNTSEDLKTFIKTNMMNSFFFENTSRFKRTDKKYSSYITTKDELLFITDCGSGRADNDDLSTHHDKDVEICRSSLLGQTYTTQMYRLENGKLNFYRFQNVTEVNYDVATYNWLNDSTLAFRTINSKLGISETYTMSGYSGTTQIASNH